MGSVLPSVVCRSERTTDGLGDESGALVGVAQDDWELVQPVDGGSSRRSHVVREEDGLREEVLYEIEWREQRMVGGTKGDGGTWISRVYMRQEKSG